jgi:TolB-like protein
MAVVVPGVPGLDSVPPEAVRLELDRILACGSFAGSKRLSSFLRFVVERTLADDTAGIKEYRIGVEVYDRGPDFDSRIDNIVRVEANRLGTKLRDYYDGIGSGDPVRIEIPKRTYTPVFYPLAGAIPAEPVSPPQVATGRSHLLRRAAAPARWVATIAAAAVAICTFWYEHSHFPATGLRRSVAVLGFKNITGRTADTAWLSTAFSEMLTMDLADTDQLRTIPIDSISQMKRDLGLSDSDGLMLPNLNRVSQSVGADLVIAGAYTVLTGQDAEQIRLDLRFRDTHTGETAATVSETGTERALFSLMDRTVSDLRRKLRLQMRLYAEGLEKLRQSNAVSARESLERAVEADPSNALAYSALASAWHALGHEAKAQDSARKAYQLAAHLNRVEQLEIEGHYRSYSHQWDAAIGIYDQLCRMFPDSIDDGLTLVETQFWAGRTRHALATVLKLRKLRPPWRATPRGFTMIAREAR